MMAPYLPTGDHATPYPIICSCYQLSLNARAIRCKAATKGKSRTSRKADIVADRLDERRTQRQIEAVMPASQPLQAIDAEVIPFQPKPVAPNHPMSLTSEANTATKESTLKAMTLAEKLKLKRLEM